VRFQKVKKGDIRDVRKSVGFFWTEVKLYNRTRAYIIISKDDSPQKQGPNGAALSVATIFF